MVMMKTMPESQQLHVRVRIEDEALWATVDEFPGVFGTGDNFDELREIADSITAHATLGGLRPAAESLGISHHKLARRLERVGLRFPLFRRDE